MVDFGRIQQDAGAWPSIETGKGSHSGRLRDHSLPFNPSEPFTDLKELVGRLGSPNILNVGLDSPRLRPIFLQSKMGPGPVIVSEVFFQHSPKIPS